MGIQVFYDGGKKVSALLDGFTVHTDQPVKAGGDASAPTPFNLFLASLGTCAGFYVKEFCDQRSIPTDKIHLNMDYEYDPLNNMIAKFIIHIHVPQDFPAQYDSALIRTASLCAVKRHLNADIENEITVVRS
ncbi:MAG: OsmC family protein [Bacteroidales bacterium]|nr:OsmC family protein [Bacteroidales bacterium]